MGEEEGEGLENGGFGGEGDEFSDDVGGGVGGGGDGEGGEKAVRVFAGGFLVVESALGVESWEEFGEHYGRRHCADARGG